MELCVGNHATSNGLVNDANGTKLFQNLLFGCIFIIFELDIIHKLEIYKSMMNFQGLTNNGYQLNVKLSKYK